jgi:hypothetical protein
MVQPVGNSHYSSRLIKTFLLIFSKQQFYPIQSTVPLQCLFVITFEQYSLFPSYYESNNSCILNRSSSGMRHFPFPDMRQLIPDIALEIRK